jgi:hypothetical protein
LSFTLGSRNDVVVDEKCLDAIIFVFKELDYDWREVG